MLQVLWNGTAIQEADNRFFTAHSRHGAHPQVYVPAVFLPAAPAIHGDTRIGYIELAHDFDAGCDFRQAGQRQRSSLTQDTIDTIADADDRIQPLKSVVPAAVQMSLW